ncbi:acetate kinase [Neorhizobium sp. NCHU2750]|uniref:acetate/propionate family kinase n=1 Tax=Neorhizobium sp. NCHU2750 TaxID=1825976 RepID=UPI000E71516D|nr:acetate kinase [Neorhizobium sp. NCHU2750]
MIDVRSFVLVVNCGSSSVKFGVFSGSGREPILSALAENLGQATSRLVVKENGEKTEMSLDGGSHDVALQKLLGILDDKDWLGSVVAVGHRIVHGGEQFCAATRIDGSVLHDINGLSRLAPLHNPANVLGVRTAMAALPSIPHVAVFDTAFHATMPPAAYAYAIPQDCYRNLGIRRYGFHGTSHRYVAMEAVSLLGLDPQDHGIVIAHLGNGASATAVRNGQSLDTSMGFTPLEGLVMGTRSGDIDPGALFHIAREDGLSIDELDTLLNRKSGLLGLSGLSNDCRTLESAAREGHEGAKLALDVFVHRLARYIGGLATSLDRLDAVVFTGGIGENSATMRKATIEHLKVLGLTLDEDANSQMFGGRCGVISTAASKPVAAVIATNEEWMIAHDTLSIVTSTEAA